jgi:hypothetical protein
MAWAAAALAVIGGAALVAFARGCTPAGPPRAGADSLATWTPDRLWRTQSALFVAGRRIESLPYAKALRDRLPDNWQARLNYAITLNGAAIEASRSGAITRTRSSVERVAMLRLALAELAAAEAYADSPRAHAALAVQTGDLERIWGMPWDALEHYVAAERRDSTWADARDRRTVWTRALREPGTPLERIANDTP